jgi:plastocyanin
MRMCAVAGVTCVAVALPTVAEAKTKSVAMGVPTRKDANRFHKAGTDVNDFFPHGVTIHVGDKVRFIPAGFHTVDLPKKNGRVNPFIAPSGKTVTGVNDAAGQPFWFNGSPELTFNPVLLKSGFGKHFTYNGRKSVLSGAPVSGQPKPFTIKFTKAGSYTYFCNIHPGMKGKVRVRPASKKIPSAAADRRALRNQVSRDLKIAKSLALTKVPANTVDVGSAGPHGVEFYGMFPLKPLTVKVGTTVTFRMTKGSFEDHTATFAVNGGGGPGKKGSYLNQLSSSFEGPGPLDPRATYSSDGPTQATLTPTLHGNGFWNSGVMERSNASPLPSFNTVKFGQAGTYQFYCLIHPFMHGTVVVQ